MQGIIQFYQNLSSLQESAEVMKENTDIFIAF